MQHDGTEKAQVCTAGCQPLAEGWALGVGVGEPQQLPQGSLESRIPRGELEGRCDFCDGKITSLQLSDWATAQSLAAHRANKAALRWC